jgi:hypothetical protein
MSRRLASLQLLLYAVSLLLGLLWVTEVRVLAKPCPWENCPLGPSPTCVQSSTQYTGAVGTLCEGGGSGDCHGWICWYRDDAGICWNTDIQQCWPWP